MTAPRPCATARIRPEGIDLTYLPLQPAEIFWRMLQYQEFDASEMSLSNYTTLVSERQFAVHRHPGVSRRGCSATAISSSTPTRASARPADLKGKRGGVPEYSMTAAVYMRGLLEHEYGVKPSDVEWVQGRADRLGHTLPADVRLTQAPPGTELGDLLERGEIDFLMTANNPLSFRRGAPNVRRLFPDYRDARAGLFPPHPHLSDHAHGGDPPRHLRARSVGGAEPLQGALPRQGPLLPTCSPETGSPKVSFAWLQPLIEEEQAIIGPDWYPYGIEQNRAEHRGAAAIHPRAGPDRRAASRSRNCSRRARCATSRSAKDSSCNVPRSGICNA